MFNWLKPKLFQIKLPEFVWTYYKKYAIIAGQVKSQTDDEWHYVTASDLLSLYNVPLDRCVIYTWGRGFAGWDNDLIRSLKTLKPKFDGDYEHQTLHLELT